MIDYVRLIDIINDEFADIVISTAIIDAKLRVVFIDNSYIDFWWSKNLPGRYAHHWERRHIDGTIYRHDNAPHTKWQHIPTYPKHFHIFTQHNPVTIAAFFSTSGVTEEWVSRFDTPGNADDFATAAAVDLDGNVFVAGYRRMLSGSTDYLTVKFDSDGNFLWMRTYDGPGKDDDVATTIAADGWGNSFGDWPK
ncbi:MAG: DUF6516 family protein [bacterium]